MDELKQLKPMSLVSWPSPQDYNEAVQNPQHSFADSNLASSLAETDNFGLPRPNTGMFASVYRMHCPDSDWALRCFLHFVPDQVERYVAIGEALSRYRFAATLDFDMQERGVRVRGQWFPVLKMQWCEGKTLDRWLSANVCNREALAEFLVAWKAILADFEEAGIAHGDLQHGNVLINNGQIMLVDYDGMYVPGLCGKMSNELGHRDYQHPRRTQEHFGPQLDHFSAWVIYLSVEVLRLDPGVWDKLRGGEDCLIFRRHDFDDPLRSATFHLLENHLHPDIRQAARTLRYLLSFAPGRVPSLSTDLLVPLDLPELLAPLGHRAWYEDEKTSSELIGEIAGNKQQDACSIGLNYQGKKRQRSRIKGGSVTMGRKLYASLDEDSSEDLATALSPLAQLVRMVRAKDTTAGQPILPAGARFCALNSRQSVRLVSIKPLVPNKAVWSVFNTQMTVALQILSVLFVIIIATFISLSYTNEQPNPLLDKGDSLMQQRMFGEAALEYKKSMTYFQTLSNNGTAEASSRKMEALATEKYGNALFAERKYEDALVAYSKTTTLYAANGDSLDQARSIGLEGRAYEALERIEDAYEAYSQAVSMYERLGVHPAVSSDMASFMAAQARSSLVAGQ